MLDLSIIISECNDPYGTVFTISSAMEELSHLNLKFDIIVIDNSTNRIYYKAMKDLIHKEYYGDKIKLLRQSFPCIFTAREDGIRASNSEYIMILDSHCLFSRDSIKEFFEVANQLDDFGFLYGPMCFTRDLASDSYCDRSISNYKGIRLSELDNVPRVFEIVFRGMPFMCKKSLFWEIGGYGTLSKYKLPWGGGDSILGPKASIMGYHNWMLSKALVYHIGPFRGDRYLPGTTMRSLREMEVYPRIGMLVAAYIVGGEELVLGRYGQLRGRLKLKSINKRMLTYAIQIAEEERRWLLKRAKVSYNELVEKFKPLQGMPQSQKMYYEDLPPAKDVIFDSTTPRKTRQKKVVNIKNHQGKGNDSWLDRIVEYQDCLKFKQSGAMS